jgi:hypothetical protein
LGTVLHFRLEVGFMNDGLCSCVYYAFLDFDSRAAFTVKPGRCCSGHVRRIGFFQRQLARLLLTDRLIEVTVPVVRVGSASDLPSSLGPLPALLFPSFLPVCRAHLERLYRALHHELWQLLAHSRLL